MLPQECLYLSEKETFRGHKGVFATVLWLEGLIGHEEHYCINTVEKIALVYILGMAEQ